MKNSENTISANSAPERYRYERGHLYEYSPALKAYVHCYQRAGLKNKAQAILEYERYEE
jgi:hypothetical protein